MANEVVINVNANTAKAKAGLAGIADKMKAVGRGATVAGGLIAGLGVASITQFAKMGDEVQKMALRTGFSTEALSELRVAAELSGSSLKGMETGIRRMSKVVIDAKDGLAESKDALDRMGVSVDDLMGKSPEEQFEILTMALADMSDKTEQVATAQEVFGRAGTALLPMLAAGSAGLEEMKQKAHEMGVVFDQEAADKAARLADSFTTLKGSFQGVMLAIAEQLAPVITDFAEKATVVVSKITKWTDANPGLTKVIVLVAAAVGGFLLVLGPLLIMLPGLIALAPVVGAAFGIMMGPVGLITVAIVALGLAWKNNFLGIRDITKKIFEAVSQFIGKAIDWIIEKINKLIDGVNALGGFFGKEIPHIETIGQAILDLGKDVVDTTKDFLGLGKAARDTDTWFKSGRFATEGRDGGGGGGGGAIGGGVMTDGGGGGVMDGGGGDGGGGGGSWGGGGAKAGVWDSTKFYAGFNALFAGENPTMAVQVVIDSRQMASTLGDNVILEGEFGE